MVGAQHVGAILTATHTHSLWLTAHLLTCQPRLPALTASAWSQLLSPSRFCPFLSSPFLTLLCQGVMTRIVHLTGPRISQETDLWVCP